MVAYFNDKEGNEHGKVKLATSWCHVVNSDGHIKCVRVLITQHLLASLHNIDLIENRASKFF